jgi:hypothetical protein
METKMELNIHKADNMMNSSYSYEDLVIINKNDQKSKILRQKKMEVSRMLSEITKSIISDRPTFNDDKVPNKMDILKKVLKPKINNKIDKGVITDLYYYPIPMMNEDEILAGLAMRSSGTTPAFIFVWNEGVSVTPEMLNSYAMATLISGKQVGLFKSKMEDSTILRRKSIAISYSEFPLIDCFQPIRLSDSFRNWGEKNTRIIDGISYNAVSYFNEECRGLYSNYYGSFHRTTCSQVEESQFTVEDKTHSSRYIPRSNPPPIYGHFEYLPNSMENNSVQLSQDLKQLLSLLQKPIVDISKAEYMSKSNTTIEKWKPHGVFKGRVIYKGYEKVNLPENMESFERKYNYKGIDLTQYMFVGSLESAPEAGYIESLLPRHSNSLDRSTIRSMFWDMRYEVYNKKGTSCGNFSVPERTFFDFCNLICNEESFDGIITF